MDSKNAPSVKGTQLRVSASSEARGDGDSMAANQPKPGEVQSLIGRPVGNFVVERLLGQGAMGSVYLAVHDTLRRKVAIKVLRPHLAQSQDLVDRFVDEAQIVSSLGHPGIAQIFDFGRLDDGQLYATMEFLDGKDLEEAIDREGRMSPGRAASIGVQVAAALAVVHDRDIVHRDLKPANLFLAIDGEGAERVKILDFGIAKLESTGAKKRTAAGHVVGTPEYMAPEQAVANGVVCGRTDIYALGCVLYELLCGHPPFDADSILGILLAQTQETPVDISERVAQLPEGLSAVVMRCLEKDPSKRWQDARALKAALLPFASELPDGVASVVQTGASIPSVPKRNMTLGLVGAAVALAAVVAFLVTRDKGDSEPAPVTATAAAATPTANTATASVPAVTPMAPDAGPEGNPYHRADVEAVAQGAAIFAATCSGCHGATGEGDGAGAPVQAEPKAFAHMAVPDGVLDTYRFESIRRGVAGVMPSFSEKLSVDETWKVVSYLSTLSSLPEDAIQDTEGLWTIEAPRMTKSMARAGKKLYVRECSSCHGRGGQGHGPAADYLGRRPANLVKGVYKLRTTDRDSPPTREDIFRTLSQGMGVSGMPAFSKLSAKQRWALVAYLRTLSKRFANEGSPEAITVPTPPPFNADAVRRGQASYLAAGCAKCHGESGLGDGPLAAELETDRGATIAAANFTVPATLIGGTSPREMYRTMMTGIAGTPMPAGDDFFDEEEAWDVVAFILSLQVK